MEIAILNTSILTAYGNFDYRAINLCQVRDIIQNAINEGSGFLSAVGHQSTAEILTKLLEVEVPVNRIQFVQEVGQMTIVFKLKGRAPEGVILSTEEIEKIGYEFGSLTRIS